MSVRNQKANISNKVRVNEQKCVHDPVKYIILAKNHSFVSAPVP